jgi:putative ABC transport system ATP-binding protein
VSVIRFENISVQFNQNLLFERLNFDVQNGEKLLVYGRSGEGKTTIIRLLLGFECPRAGNIYFEGKLLDRKTIWDIRKEIAYVSQNLDIGAGKVTALINRVLNYTANENINPSKTELSDMLKFLRLKESILQENFEKLSGGEKQRILIVIALLLKRSVFLLDEVTSALDSELKEKVRDFFLKRDDWTVIVISHDKDWLQRPELKVINLDKINERT